MIIASKLHPKNIIPHLWLNVIPGKKQCTSIILLFFEFQPILPILLSSNFLDLPTYKNPRPGNSQASKSYMILRRLQPASRAIPWGLRLKQPFLGGQEKHLECNWIFSPGRDENLKYMQSQKWWFNRCLYKIFPFGNDEWHTDWESTWRLGWKKLRLPHFARSSSSEWGAQHVWMSPGAGCRQGRSTPYIGDKLIARESL